MPLNTAEPRRSRRRVWSFRLLSITLTPLLLLLVEGGLRLCGVGRDIPLFEPVTHLDGTTWGANPRVDQVYFGRTDLAGPEPRHFQLPKPFGTYRIVWLGESTVQGFPFGSEIAFPRQVELMLRRQSPELKFESLNLGITGINSFALADMAQLCLQAEPDLVVVHAGHNEFYGPGGPASSALQLPPAVLRQVLPLRRWRLAQLLPAAPPLQDDMLDTLPATLSTVWDSPAFTQAEKNYRDNLSSILDTVGRAGVPVLVSTVGCNLRQPPLRSLDAADDLPDRQAEWDSAVEQAEQQLWRRDWPAAERTLAQAEEIHANSARLVFRQAQCRAEQGHVADALSAFQRARDLDVCRFRAPSTFAEIARGLVTERGDPNLFFLDIAAALPEHADGGIPGYELFVEHVHYTLRGHRLLAKLFSRSIQEQVRGKAWAPGRTPDDVELDQLLGIVPEDAFSANVLVKFLLKANLFDGSVDADKQRRAAQTRLDDAFADLAPERREVVLELPKTAYSEQLLKELVQLHLLRRHHQIAYELAQADAIRTPDSSVSQFRLAIAATLVDDAATAAQAITAYQRLEPRLAAEIEQRVLTAVLSLRRPL